MVKYGKVSDREMHQCFHARMITIITVKVVFSRVLAFTMFWKDVFNFCKYDRFLVLLSHHLYFVVYFAWSLIRKKWELKRRELFPFYSMWQTPYYNNWYQSNQLKGVFKYPHKIMTLRIDNKSLEPAYLLVLS